jgi:glyoxylase-like metal-dependent hydrolase (beta-lactamase superfamily II)
MSSEKSSFENQPSIEINEKKEQEHWHNYLTNLDLMKLKEEKGIQGRELPPNEVGDVLRYVPRLSNEELAWTVEEYESLILPNKVDESKLDLDQVRLAALYQELRKREQVEASLEGEDTVEKIRENMWLLSKRGSQNPVSVVFRQGNDLFVTDPGTSRLSKGKNRNLSEIEKGLSAEIKGIFLTHAHPDHITNISNIAGQDIPVYAHKNEHRLLRSPAMLAKIADVYARKSKRAMGEPRELKSKDLPFPGWQLKIFPAYAKAAYGSRIKGLKKHGGEVKGGYLEFPKESMQFDCYSVEVIETPGHTPGEVSFWIPEDKILVGGDLIPNTHYRDNLASFPLPEANVYDAIKSLKKIRDLSPKLFIPSHGEPIRGEAEIRERTEKMIEILEEMVRKVNELREKDPQMTFEQMAELVFPAEESPQGLHKWGFQREKESTVQSIVRDAPKT